MRTISPLSGWMLDAAVELDQHHSGFCGRYLCASGERRHVIAAYLATRGWTATGSAPDTGLKAEAVFLHNADHRSILEAAFGSCPIGLRGVLGRAGPQPLGRPAYRTLFQLLSDPAEATAAAVLKQLRTVDQTRINIVKALPPALRYAPLIEAIDAPSTARDLTESVSLIREKGGDSLAFVEALKRVRASDGFDDLLHRWSLRLKFPAAPIPASANFTPVENGKQLTKVALAYRNCARTLAIDLAEGSAAIGEYRHGSEAVLVHLVHVKNEWCCDNLYGYRNRSVADDIHVAASAFLLNHGIEWRDKHRDRTGKMFALRRLTSGGLFRF